MITKEQLATWRKDRTLAHVVPFGVFMIFNLLGQFIGEKMLWEHDDAPWYLHYPDQLFYPLQTLFTGGALIFFWKHYEFSWNTKKVLIGILAGLIGIGFWILPTQIYDWLGMTGKPESFIEKLTGLAPRREGFDPFVFESAAASYFSLIMRLMRAIVIVALVEEIFWRGFLMRFLLDLEGDYWKQPFGKPAKISFIVVTLAFMLAHAPLDWLGALVYGSLAYGITVWTRSLLAVVVMHGVANATMAYYALHHGKLGLW